MRLYMQTVLWGLMGLTASPVLAQEQLHDYILLSYPVSANDCHAVASSFGERFQAELGYNVRISACDRGAEGGFDIRIRYLSEDPASLVTTYMAAGHPSRNPAAYASQESCNEALPVERAHFERATGLSVFAAYCWDTGSFNRPRWATRFDAFGEPVARPYYAGEIIFGSPVGYTRSSFEADVKAALESRGVDVVFTRLSSESIYSRLTAFYYAQTPLAIKVGEHAKVENLEDCRLEADDLMSDLRDASLDSLIHYCARQAVGYIELQTLSMGESFDLTPTIETFSSFDACRREKVSLIEHYREMSGRSIISGTCSKVVDAGVWTVLLVGYPSKS